MSSLTAQATEAALLSAGRTTQLVTTLIATDKIGLSPNPWALPAPLDAGFSTLNTVSVDLRVTFHRNPQARTVWLVIDETAAPLTGDYIAVVDGNSVTYDATSSAPADRDALLQGWVDAINGDGTVGPLVTATRVKLKDPSGSYDAVRLEAAPATASVAGGIPAGSTYSTFALGAATEAPAAAVLHVVREVDKASLAVFTKPGFTKSSPVVSNLNGPVSDLVDAWTRTFDFGAQDEEGFDERLNFASRAAGFVHLYSPVTTDDTFTIQTSADGIYGVTNVVAGILAPAVAS